METKERLERSRESLRRMGAAASAENRRRFRATTMEQRLESAFQLNDLTRELGGSPRRRG